MMTKPARTARIRAAVVPLAWLRICAPRTIALLAVLSVPSVVLAQSVMEHDDPESVAGPKLTVRAFGDVQWGATQRHDRPNSFALGQLDLFATSTLTERISVLAEIVFEGGTNTRVVTDLERLQLTYRHNDNLSISAGRFHTGLGFYNAAFHHGAFFETPIGRPKVFAFEDEGGVLPVHEVGLTVRGAVPKSGASLYYLFEVGNGRNWTASDSETDELDENGAKSTNVGLSYRPERWRGLEIGASYYRDTVPQGSLPAVAHRIAVGYVAYRTPAIEILAEWLNLEHRANGGPRYRNNAGYVQASKAWGRIRPYYRYDRATVDVGTPLIGDVGSYTAHIAGVRIDTSEWVGIKAQYQRTNDTSQRGVDSVRTQLVFVF